MSNLSASLVQFSPELILVIGAAVLLTVDLVSNGREAGQNAIGLGTILLQRSADPRVLGS